MRRYKRERGELPNSKRRGLSSAWSVRRLDIVRTFHLMCVRCILTCSRIGITKQRYGTTLRAEGAAHRGPVRESNQICPSGFALVRAVRLAWLASAVRRAFRELWGLLGLCQLLAFPSALRVFVAALWACRRPRGR